MNDETITRITPTPPARDGSGGAWLCVIEGEARGAQVEINDGGEVSIGRRPGNHLVLPSSAVSKDHARVIHDGRQTFIEDVGSTNGTTVNHLRLEPRERRALFHGDILVVGDHTLIFRHESANFADKTGMSTISFDMSEVREEADRLLGDWIKTD